jgi:threonine/homoserine/homoserine lactone efflux protein
MFLRILPIKQCNLKAIIIYLTTAIVSYIATIPPGPLSLFVVHTTLQKSIKIALWVALGGVFCESIYAFLAMQGVMIFDKYPMVEYWIQRAIIALLLVVGTYTFFQKSEEIVKEKVLVHNKLLSFLKGISLSLFNPALLPFWLVVLIEYRSNEILKINETIEKFAFVLGAGTGTFLLVFTYGIIADKKRNLVYKYLTDSRLNKVMGIIFIGLAIWQLTNMLLK